MNRTGGATFEFVPVRVTHTDTTWVVKMTKVTAGTKAVSGPINYRQRELSFHFFNS
jgi:hypothetical protein